MSVSHDIFYQIFDNPAADNGIIGHNQYRNNRVDPAAKGQPFRFSKGTVSAYRALLCHTSQSCLCYDHGVAEGQGQNDINQKENTAAVFGGQVRKAPDIAQAYGSACSRKHKAQFSRKRASFVVV